MIQVLKKLSTYCPCENVQESLQVSSPLGGVGWVVEGEGAGWG